MNNFDALTLEDFRLILAIVEEGSLTRGANRLNISQSNASYSLKKIQGAFGSDLFLRKGRKLVPNEFGLHVFEHTKIMLEEFQAAVQPPVFDPRDEFTLSFAATEYEAVAVFPQIIKMLKEHAPKAHVNIVGLDASDIVSQFSNHDFLFAPIEQNSKAIGSLKILEDDYVTVFDRSERQAPTSLEAFVSARHAIVSFNGSATTQIDTLLAKKGMHREIALSVFGFSALTRLIRNTDLISTLPKRIATGALERIDMCDCPLKTEPMPLYLCWEKIKEERGKIRWFIEKMTTLF